MRRHHSPSYIAELERTLKHLDSVVGHQIRALDAALGRVSGRKKAVPREHALRSRTAFTNSLFPSLIGDAGSLFGNVTGLSKNDTFRSLRVSQKQLWADAASAIARATKRNL